MGGFDVQETSGNRRDSADSPEVVSPPDDVWPAHASIDRNLNTNPNRNSADSPEVVSPPDDVWPTIDHRLNRNSALSPEAVEDVKDPVPKYVVVDDDADDADKYVVPREGDDAKYIDYEKAALNSPETIDPDNPIIAISGPTIVKSSDADTESNKTREPRTICGLSRRLFLILLVVATALIAGGIGGGVAGGLIANNKKPPPPPLSSLNGTSSSNSSFPPPPGPPPDPNDPRLHIGEFQFQAFSATNWSDKATEPITTPGNHTLPFEAISYTWTNKNTGYDSGCCATFCNHDFGFSYLCQSKESADLGEEITHVIIGCGPAARGQAPCSPNAQGAGAPPAMKGRNPGYGFPNDRVQGLL